VASGHLHKAHDFELDGTRYLWAPSTAFLCGPSVQPPMPGDKRLGAVRYEIAGSELRAAIVEVRSLVEYWIDDIIEELYPLHLDSRPVKS
jgi:hypothetical protein